MTEGGTLSLSGESWCVSDDKREEALDISIKLREV